MAAVYHVYITQIQSYIHNGVVNVSYAMDQFIYYYTQMISLQSQVISTEFKIINNLQNGLFYSSVKGRHMNQVTQPQFVFDWGGFI